MNLRRRLLAFLAFGLATAVALLPKAALGQPAKRLARIGILDDGDRSTRAPYWQVFRERLRELGYIEGMNLTIESRWADGEPSRLPQLAAELVRLEPNVIVATGTPPTRAAMLATSTIPIFFTDSADPIKAELVASLARPAGNVTGFSIMSTAIAGKWIELLREVNPSVKRVAFLGPASNAATMAVFQQLQRDAKTVDVEVRMLDSHDAASIETAFATMASERIDAVIVTATAILLPHRQRIVELAERRRLPAIYARHEYVEAGGLMSYGTDFSVLFSHAAERVHQILQGAKPSSIPVEQPMTLRMEVNRNAAKALGITLPFTILLRANRVIE